MSRMRRQPCTGFANKSAIDTCASCRVGSQISRRSFTKPFVAFDIRFTMSSFKVAPELTLLHKHVNDFTYFRLLLRTVTGTIWKVHAGVTPLTCFGVGFSWRTTSVFFILIVSPNALQAVKKH